MQQTALMGLVVVMSLCLTNSCCSIVFLQIQRAIVGAEGDVEGGSGGPRDKVSLWPRSHAARTVATAPYAAKCISCLSTLTMFAVG